MSRVNTQPGANGKAKPGATGQANGKPKKTMFVSGPQIVVARAGGKVSAGKGKVSSSRRSPITGNREALFTEMLNDPTIKLAVDVVSAMLKRQPWVVESENPAWADYVQSQVDPWRKLFVRSGLRGYLIDGWRAFEVLYGVDEMNAANGYSVLGVKPLKTKLTTPLAYEDTGEFAGVENRPASGGQESVEIDERHVVYVNFDEDGFGEPGAALLEVAAGPHVKWERCDVGAQRYDKKVAGGFLFIQYPVGRTPYAGNGGADTDNSEIMVALADSFEAAGFGGVPVLSDPETGKAIDGAWKVEHVAAGGGLQPNFVARAKYLDALKLRAFGIPERSTTEGTMGTKAEAEAHADIAVIVNMDRHEVIVDCVDANLVQTLNLANYGDKDATRLKLGRLDPADRELFSQIFTALMTDPVFGEQIAAQVDTAVLLDKLNVPTRAIDDVLAEQEESSIPAPGEEPQEEQPGVPAPGQPGQPPKNVPEQPEA